MTTAAKSAFGTTLTWNSQAVAGLNNIGGVEITVEMLDATNHSSTSGLEEVIAGIARTGEVTIEGDFKYDDANGQIAMVTDAVAKTSRTAVITFPNSLGIWTFTAFISRIKVGDNPIDGKIPFSASFKITGVPALTVTASAGLTTPFFVISESAVVAAMIHTPDVGALFAAMNALNRARTSSRISSAVLPDELIGVGTFVIDAGDTFDDAVLSGSMKSMSSRSRSAAARESRTIISADGLESRRTSSVTTAILATLSGASVVREKSNAVSGFGLPSPTQYPEPPPV